MINHYHEGDSCTTWSNDQIGHLVRIKLTILAGNLEPVTPDPATNRDFHPNKWELYQLIFGDYQGVSTLSETT